MRRGLLLYATPSCKECLHDQMAALLFVLAGIALMLFMVTRVFSFGYDRGDGTVFLIGVGLVTVRLI
jgi:hypothetical protein